MYPLMGVVQNTAHVFTVKMRSSSGAVIEPLEARTYIQGTGFDVSNVFDGYIDAEDDIYLIPLGELELLTMNDNAEITINAAAVLDAMDNLKLHELASLSAIPLEEGSGVLSPHVYFQTIFGYILTESGDVLTTESGDRLIL